MSKTLKHKSKADYLLEKGINVLWCKGYNGTSVNDIVKEAGIPKGSFYFYFDSKEDFVVKAVEKYFNQMFAPAKNILEDVNFSPKQRLINFYEFRHELMVNEMECKLGCLASNLGNEMSEHSDKIRIKIVEFEDKIKETITEVFVEAQNINEIDTTFKASNIVDFIEDAGKGAMITMKEKQNSEPLDNLLTFVLKLFLK